MKKVLNMHVLQRGGGRARPAGESSLGCRRESQARFPQPLLPEWGPRRAEVSDAVPVGILENDTLLAAVSASSLKLLPLENPVARQSWRRSIQGPMKEWKQDVGKEEI